MSLVRCVRLVGVADCAKIASLLNIWKHVLSLGMKTYSLRIKSDNWRSLLFKMS
jgi:hypothetical protein